MGILEKIKDIELEMSRTQKNKATEGHLGILKSKLAKLRTELLAPPKSGGGEGDGFEVSKYGHGRVALIGLSTARPSAPFLATGRLGERQLVRLDRMLAETAASGLFRVVLLHHPPAAHTVRWRKSLLDGAALRDVLARHGVELVLHGHAHFSAATYLDAAHGRNLAIGVPSQFTLS